LNLTEIRKHVPITERLTYINHAAAGPLTLEAANEMKRIVDEQMYLGSNFQVWTPYRKFIAEKFAKIIGAKSKEEIAYAPNVTTGLWAFASSLKLGKDKNVVITDLEFGTNIWIWHALKAQGKLGELRIVRNVKGDIPIEKFKDAIDKNTAVVGVTYVSSMNGFRANTKEIANLAHESGALMLSDAFQAFGLVPIDVQQEGIDVLATGTYKWILGPSGYGFLYVKSSILPDLGIGLTGWQGIHPTLKESLEHPFDLERLELPQDATRFETGVHPIIPAYGVGAALDFAVQNQTISKFEDTQKRLVAPLMEGVKKLGAKVQSPEDFTKLGATISIADKNPPEAVDFFKKRGIIVSWHWVPGMSPGIRVAPHFYNTIEEVDRFLNALKEYSTEKATLIKA
jgi:cysteine desulfurase/selenocysteine lyase